MDGYVETSRKPAATDTGLSPIWSSWIDPAALERLRNHDFLVACREGRASLPAIRTFLVQHHHYSKYFTRFLCALISNLPESDDVRHIAQNLIEEMGADEREGVTHAELYQQAMRAAGTRPAAMPAFEATRALVDAMFDHCRREDALDGLASLCLGAEAIVPLIYQPIIDALEALGQPKDAIRFFALHVEDDEDHALAMLEIMERLAAEDTQRRARAIAIGTALIDRRIEMLDAVAANARFLETAIA